MVGLTDNKYTGLIYSDPDLVSMLFENMPLGFVYLSYVYDSTGAPVDLKIEAINRNLEMRLGLGSFAGRSAMEALGREARHLLKVCKDIENSKGQYLIEDFLFTNSVKLSVVANQVRKGEFACFVSPNQGILTQTESESENIGTFSEPQALLRVNADIQHMLRTHLNAILGFAELLNEETDQNNKVRYMEIIRDNVQALMDSSIVKKSEPGTLSTDQSIDQHSNKPRILVAEDTESNYMLVSYILKAEYDLIWAKDGIEAVEAFEKEHPDLILMDVRMPRMSGLAATERIRESDKAIPIIALTAFAFESDKAKTMEAGCTDFIAKPINAMALKEIVKRHLR